VGQQPVVGLKVLRVRLLLLGELLPSAL